MSGCGGVDCPPGSTLAADRCVADDASVPDGATTDTSAPQCTDAADCSEPASMCAGGACVECVSDADCSALRPRCIEGACRACIDDGVACTTRELASTWMAAACRAFTLLEGDDDELVSLAQVCSARDDVFPSLAIPSRAVAQRRITIDLEWLRMCLESTSGHWAALACYSATRPSVSDTQACYDDLECLSHHCEGTSCPRSCAARSAEGRPCSGDAECADDLYCAAGSCAPLPTASEPCTPGRECGGPTFCNSANLCETYRGRDAPCTLDGGECMLSLVCRETTLRCQDPPPAGEACQLSIVTDTCAAGARCKAGMCVASRALGASCAMTYECERGARCIVGTCRPIRMLRDRCSETAPCAVGLACNSGRCAPLPNVGEPCTAAVGCIRGTCTGGMCTSLTTGASCTPSRFDDDALDPCGDLVSCEGTACASELPALADCSAGGRCNRPTLECSGTCQPICVPPP